MKKKVFKYLLLLVSIFIIILIVGFYYLFNQFTQQSPSSVDKEVDETYCGRYVDRVLFGTMNMKSFKYHHGVLEEGNIESDSFILKNYDHTLSWDFTTQKAGYHVLALNCKIYDSKRLATPLYMKPDGTWRKLPQMPYREPWYENKIRYYLIDIPQGIVNIKVIFSGKKWKMFFIQSAELFEEKNNLPDTSAPLILDYIAIEPAANTCDISWTSNEEAIVQFNYGQDIKDFDGSDTVSEFSLEHKITISGLIEQTHYYFTISQTDFLGNHATHGPFEFTTLSN